MAPTSSRQGYQECSRDSQGERNQYLDIHRWWVSNRFCQSEFVQGGWIITATLIYPLDIPIGNRILHPRRNQIRQIHPPHCHPYHSLRCRTNPVSPLLYSTTSHTEHSTPPPSHRNAGFTSAEGNKIGVNHPQNVPRAIIYDAELSLHTPNRLWVSSGVRALDHALENLYREGTPGPVRVMCREAVGRMFVGLKRCSEDEKNVEARQGCFEGAWMSLVRFTYVARSDGG